MEERIIDDEYGRGIRLKKTKDGYVDATDEQLEDEEVDEVEEMQFAFPMLDGEEDDEDLATLSPEEALKLRQEKMEREKARKAEYERLCAEGFALLETESFRSAELKRRCIWTKRLRTRPWATGARRRKTLKTPTCWWTNTPRRV